MKLIDADKIEYTSIAHLASYHVAPSPCDTVMRAEINAMPTIDAVPVDWIDKYTYENPLTCYEGFHAYIRNMICEWRKENEQI